LLLGPRGLPDTQSMIVGLHQAVTSGQIPMDQINASVQRIIEMKLHYKILTRDKALQLIDNGEAIVIPSYYAQR
jgi:beta-N-acetylhexosaminidase